MEALARPAERVRRFGSKRVVQRTTEEPPPPHPLHADLSGEAGVHGGGASRRGICALFAAGHPSFRISESAQPEAKTLAVRTAPHLPPCGSFPKLGSFLGFRV